MVAEREFVRVARKVLLTAVVIGVLTPRWRAPERPSTLLVVGSSSSVIAGAAEGLVCECCGYCSEVGRIGGRSRGGWREHPGFTRATV